jgi:hypothetical protein
MCALRSIVSLRPVITKIRQPNNRTCSLELSEMKNQGKKKRVDLNFLNRVLSTLFIPQKTKQNAYLTPPFAQVTTGTLLAHDRSDSTKRNHIHRFRADADGLTSRPASAARFRNRSSGRRAPSRRTSWARAPAGRRPRRWPCSRAHRRRPHAPPPSPLRRRLRRP